MAGIKISELTPYTGDINSLDLNEVVIPLNINGKTTRMSLQTLLSTNKELLSRVASLESGHIQQQAEIDTNTANIAKNDTENKAVDSKQSSDIDNLKSKTDIEPWTTFGTTFE